MAIYRNAAELRKSGPRSHETDPRPAVRLILRRSRRHRPSLPPSRRWLALRWRCAEMADETIKLRVRIGDENGPMKTLAGRDAWALEVLIERGERGATPIDAVGPRWSHYIWKIRGEGIVVETINESHGGPFKGRHARYVLRSPLIVVDRVRAGEDSR
jgi:hypothetical protein